MKSRSTNPLWPFVAASLVIAVILGVMIGRHAASSMPTSSGQPDVVAAKSNPVNRVVPVSAPMTFEQRQAKRRAAIAEQERRGQALHAALATRFATEKPDAAWASAKEAKLLAASTSDEIRRANAQPRNYTATCRSSVCKIGADFDNRGALEDWLTLFSTGLGSELPSEAYVLSTNQDGSLHLEIMGIARK